jgi:D-inositol-3-phosphate glycosyltransferase
MTSGRSAMVVSHYYAPHVGGIETVVRHHSAGLQALGWNVAVHTSRVPSDAARTARLNGVDIVRHRAANPFEERLRLPIPVPLPGTSAALRRAAHQADVVIVHGHVYPIGLLAARAARSTRTPYVVVQHSPWVDYPFPLAQIERGADRTIGRWILEGAERVVCVSAFTETFVRSIAPKAKTLVVPNGVDTGYFRKSAVSALDRMQTPTAITVRRLVPRAGVDLLLDAWRACDLDGVGRLVIGGRGPEEARLRNQARGLRNVRFVGFVPDTELVSLYQTATVAVMPTRSGEGFGLMAAEALACGTPVVVTAQGALPEVVRHDVDGLVVAQDDPAALGAALRSILTDESLAERLRAGALATDWSWTSSVERFSDVLTDVVERSAT